jgi:stage V sporulation protein R
MLDVIGGHATRVRRYVDAFGLEEVERFLDCVLSCETLIDPYLPLRESKRPDAKTERPPALSERSRRALESLTRSPLSPPTAKAADEPDGLDLPTYDVLGFLAEHAPVLPWQRDVLRLVRREAYYFSPQRMTQIMNEGWASFWHSRLLTRTLLEPSEIVDFADTHSGATTARAGELNPYKLGLELWRWAESSGEDVFRLRRLHNDVSFLDMLIGEDFAERSYYFRGVGSTPNGPKDWREAKAALLAGLAWGGLPRIELVGVEGASELVLVHHHDGRDLQLDRAGQTLVNLERIWRAPVVLLTVLEGQGKKLVCEDGEVRFTEHAPALERCLDAAPSADANP